MKVLDLTHSKYNYAGKLKHLHSFFYSDGKEWKMEIVRNGCCSIKSFISAVIEWRSAATAPYFMFINSAFW